MRSPILSILPLDGIFPNQNTITLSPSMMNLDSFSESIKTSIAYSYHFWRQTYLSTFRYIAISYWRMHHESRRRDSNPQSIDYKSIALPLRHDGIILGYYHELPRSYFICELTHIPLLVKRPDSYLWLTTPYRFVSVTYIKPTIF